MYLSKLIPYTKRDYSAKIDHRLVMKGFPFAEANSRQLYNVLFRDEPEGFAIVQSAVKPDWGHCLPSENYQVKEFEPVAIELGRRYRIRVAFAPIKQKDRRERRISPEEWLERHPLGGDLEIDRIHESTGTDWSGDNVISVNRAVVDGYLTVVDPAKVEYLLVNGVGRKKAYGCGLMSLIRA
jgi:CRISPR system Cascade subunit CasE